jgi:hypothetical protein
MAQFQGPALCAFNNAVFRDEDFESIQNVGAGRKSNDPIATGRFGLGFNSVYHMVPLLPPQLDMGVKLPLTRFGACRQTDLPSFVTRDKVVFFDPHRTHLPGIEHGPPGTFPPVFILSQRLSSRSCPRTIVSRRQILQLHHRRHEDKIRRPVRALQAIRMRSVAAFRRHRLPVCITDIIFI